MPVSVVCGTLGPMTIHVYVPTSSCHARIDPGSGVVAAAAGPGRLLADYEGNRYNAANIVTYADRVHHAAGRAAVSYPTLARAVLPASALVRVGTWDDKAGRVHLDGDAARAAVRTWLGLEDTSAGNTALDVQLVSTSVRHQMRAEIEKALACGDPAAAMAARAMARRYYVELG